MKIKLLIEGGDMKPGPAIAQQLGPMGINMGKVISKINESTKEFKGMKVPVELDINEKTKEFNVKTSSPPTAELLKKELKLEKGSNNHKELKMGNASIEDIIKIAKIKHSDMLEKELKAAVKSVIGTCASIGIFVEDKEPKEITEDIIAGKFDKEINQQKTETSPEKRKKLDEFFKKIKNAQEEKIKKEQKLAEEKEAAKQAEEKNKVPEKAAVEKAPEKKAEKKVEKK